MYIPPVFPGLKGSAIGKNIVNAKVFGEKRRNNDIGLEDGIYTALSTLKDGFEGQMTEKTKEIFCTVL
jgi:20S proteasome subunit alpha 2